MYEYFFYYHHYVHCSGLWSTWFQKLSFRIPPVKYRAHLSLLRPEYLKLCVQEDYMLTEKKKPCIIKSFQVKSNSGEKMENLYHPLDNSLWLQVTLHLTIRHNDSFHPLDAAPLADAALWLKCRLRFKDVVNNCDTYAGTNTPQAHAHNPLCLRDDTIAHTHNIFSSRGCFL